MVLRSELVEPPDHDASITNPKPGFDAEYFPILRAVEDRHFWFRARNAVLDGLVQQLEAPLKPGYRVLEVGCGTGNTLRVLRERCRRGSFVGVDFQHDGLAYARERTGSPLVQADICCAPFLPAIRFNLIGIFDVLEHIDDDRRMLDALRSWTAPGGALLITVPAAPALWSPFDVAACHRRRYTVDTLREKLVEAGFRIEYLSPFMACLYPLLWAHRRFPYPRRRGRLPFDMAREELRVVPVVNSALAWLLWPEPAVIRARRRIPFGTSLIAIAR
jgi:SAM-dependent methyltransferase